MNILHQGENFLLAELPQLEAGVRTLLSKSGEEVMLHRLVEGAAAVSTPLNIPLLRTILAALDSATQPLQ